MESTYHPLYNSGIHWIPHSGSRQLLFGYIPYLLALTVDVMQADECCFRRRAQRKMGNIFIAIVYSEFQKFENKAMKGIPIVIFYCVTYNLY